MCRNVVYRIARVDGNTLRTPYVYKTLRAARDELDMFAPSVRWIEAKVV